MRCDKCISVYFQLEYPSFDCLFGHSFAEYKLAYIPSMLVFDAHLDEPDFLLRRTSLNIVKVLADQINFIESHNLFFSC